MDPHEEQELQESLDFMRKQFQALTDDIKIPDSLRADLLKKQLELMEDEQEEQAERSRRRKKTAGKRAVFPLRSAMGVAACVLVVSVSFLSFQLGRASGGGVKTGPASSSTVVEMEPTAVSDEAADDAGVPAEAAMDAPTPFDESALEGAAIPEPAMLQAPASPEKEEAAAGVSLPESDEMPVSPTARNVAQAQGGPYSAYFPKVLPDGLELAGTTELESSAFLSYLNEDYSRQIQMTLRPASPSDVAVDPNAPEMYDLRLYTPPYTDSVPAELASSVNNPVFEAGDLSVARLESRIFDSGGGAPRGNFSVLFPSGMVAELNVTGVSAAEVYAMVSSMNM